MKVEISLKEIPIFKYLDKSQTNLLSQIFNAKDLPRNHVILFYGNDVPGLYIVAEGEISVYTENNDALLAKMARGGSFGEMSLIEHGQKSSANIVVSSQNATLLFCPRPAFTKLLEREASIASSFYRGAAELLSQRLRNANEQIGTQIGCAHKLLTELLNASNITIHLGKTHSDVLNTGDNVAGKLFGVIPQLEEVAKKHPNCQEDLERIQKTIEDLLLIETQNFDRISQQIDLIKQYFSNIKRVLRGDKPLDIKGDTRLFER